MLCENHVTILRLLSEEIFDFSKESLTAAKAEALRGSLTTQLAGIFELFDFVLQAAARPSLLNATLQTLQRYVTWIPDSYVFETRLLETLILKVRPAAPLRRRGSGSPLARTARWRIRQPAPTSIPRPPPSPSPSACTAVPAPRRVPRQHAHGARRGGRARQAAVRPRI